MHENFDVSEWAFGSQKPLYNTVKPFSNIIIAIKFQWPFFKKIALFFNLLYDENLVMLFKNKNISLFFQYWGSELINVISYKNIFDADKNAALQSSYYNLKNFI